MRLRLLHLQEHFLLGQVLLLRSRGGASALIRSHVLLLVRQVLLILLNLLHEHDLLLFRQLVVR